MPRDARLLDRLGIELPIFLSPMAGSGGLELAVAVSEAGGLGAMPWTFLSVDKMRADMGAYRQRTSKPVNVNFFVHKAPVRDAAKDEKWKAVLAPYYRERGLDPQAPVAPWGAPVFSEAAVAMIEETKPEVVSFHFGLPPEDLFRRVKATGAFIVSTATTVAEARWLEAHGVDAIIAQGFEAGGHRGIFLDMDLTSQIGTLALVPQVADAVDVPVIAAGGIADGRGLAAALVLGASAAQIGTAYLFTPEALTSKLHRTMLGEVANHTTAMTNLFTGRPARSIVNRLMRELGPVREAPDFPVAGERFQPLKNAAEATGSNDYSLLNTGQAAALGKVTSARELTREIAEGAEDVLRALGRS